MNDADKKFIDMVQQERKRQDAKWGKQTHSLLHWLAILTEEHGEFAKETVEVELHKERIKAASELHSEANREWEMDPAHCRYRNPTPDAIKELVEVAAVAQSIYEQYFMRDSLSD